jgi:WhiB family redox-sensing transcriptional regulator
VSADWRSSELCLDEPEFWFPVGISPAAQAQAAEAKAVCRTCPVVDTCRDWSLTFRPRLTDGIFAGLDGDDRTRLWRAQSRQDARERQEAQT